MIGSTRRINPHTATVEFTRPPSNGHRGHESIIFWTHPREKHRLIFQIGSGSPKLAVEAARLVAGDVAGIDLNAGCPKPFSTLGGMGAALLRKPSILCDILQALVNDVGKVFEIGISVKIRLLETPEMTENLVRQLCATGITGLTVHCRTTDMRPRERAIRDQLKMVASVCRENGIACLMNGDVENRSQALQLIEEYQVDGAMIATCAEKNPSCFRGQEDGGLLPWRDVAHEYLKTCLEVENIWPATKNMLLKLMPGKVAIPMKIQQMQRYSDCCHKLEFNDLIDLAKKVDERRGFKPQNPSANHAKLEQPKPLETKTIQRKRKRSPDGQDMPKRALDDRQGGLVDVRLH